jgi:hypothetical protein
MTMTDKRTQASADHSNMQKDPSTWVTGDEPMTGAQHSYVETLAEEAGEEIDESMTKAEASMKIEELQQETGRGVSDASTSNAKHQGAGGHGSRAKA